MGPPWLAEYAQLTLRALSHSFKFSGRSTRTELVVYYLASILVMLVWELIGGLILDLDQARIADQVFGLALLLPIPALLFRRFHDQDRTGQWLWLSALVFVLWAARKVVVWQSGIDARIALDKTIWPLDWLATFANIVTLLLIVLPGTDGPNRFGPDPRRRSD
jgi:uncharacterized membrane protein YhaH (DUF805 family)